MKYAIVLMFCSIFSMAQDAVVVELSKSDAVQAKQLYDAKVAADKAWDDFNGKLNGTYNGFYNGIKFSSDFRFIVPKIQWQDGYATIYPYWNNGLYYYGSCGCGYYNCCSTSCAVLLNTMSTTSTSNIVPATVTSDYLQGTVGLVGTFTTEK